MAGRVIKGVSWSAVQQFSTQIIQFVVTIVLARILTPDEFGVVAASMIVLAVMQVINETGFGAALMQKLDRDETDFFSVFVLNIIMGLVLYGFIYLTAPLWALVFKSPQLESVIRYLGLNLIFASFIVVQRTKLLIKVDFKTWTKASVSAAIISGAIGIYMAHAGYGVYALVAQSLILSFLSTAFIWLMVRWRPTVSFSFSRLKGLFQFAYKLIAARLINTIFNEVYASVIAIVFNPAQLAFFNRAKSFETLSSNNIVSIVQRVAVPVMCEKQHSEIELRNVTLTFIRNTALIITPLIILLFTLSKPLIVCLLTDKWIECAGILRIICVAGFFYNISAFNMNIYNATGRTDLALKCEIVKKIVSIAIIAIAVVFKNFDVLIWSYIVCSIIECIINTRYTYSQIHASFLYQLKGLMGIVSCAFVMGMYIFMGTLIIDNYYLQLAILSISGMLLYITLCYMLNICDCRKYIASKLRKP